MGVERMMNVGAKLNSVLEYVRESHDPYVRLVNRAMSVSASGVPFYQLEELREASFQSDHACEMIVKTLLSKLDFVDAAAAASATTSAAIVTVNKALTVFRVLYLEGAGGIRARMAQVRGVLHRVRDIQGVRTGTLDASNRELADALLQAMDGNSRSLTAFSTSYASGRKETMTETLRLQKSEFKAMHEREQRMYRKQCEEEKRHSEVIVQERVYGTFDGGLAPDKLVEQVLMSPKKRFAQKELESFAFAAAATGKVQEVCAGLELQLQDVRQSLQNRYKVLLVVEALVSSDVAEAREYYRGNSTGIRRHLQLSLTDNSVKAEAAMKTAGRILLMLQGQRQAPSAPAIPEPLPPATGAPKRLDDAPQKPASFSIDDLFSDLSVCGAVARPSSSSSSPFSSPQPRVNAATADIVNTAPPIQPVVPASGMSSCGITALSSVPRPSQQVFWRMHPPHDSLLSSVSSDHGALQQHVALPPPVGGCERLRSLGGEEVSRTFNSLTSLDSACQMHSTSATGDVDKLQLMQQIQAQMEATRRMLEQQQVAFLALQAELKNK